MFDPRYEQPVRIYEAKVERKEPAHAMEQSYERTYHIWGIIESWFDYIEEKAYFF